jgi:hypothetical protein
MWLADGRPPPALLIAAPLLGGCLKRPQREALSIISVNATGGCGLTT